MPTCSFERARLPVDCIPPAEYARSGRACFAGSNSPPTTEVRMAAPSAFDEMTGNGGAVRDAYRNVKAWLDSVPPDVLAQRSAEAEQLFRRIGITFAVYGDAAGTERLIPFDIVPRVLTAREWDKLARGLEQRVRALNMFIKDAYGACEVVRAGVVPEELVLRNPQFRPEMTRIRLPHDIYVMIAGIDIVRVDDDTFYVLEDNARTPSGVSYMLENREVMMRLLPELFTTTASRRSRTIPTNS